jgi:hypothetical protein
MTTQETLEITLKSINLPHKDIHCFGSFVHVTCFGKDTAEKWNSILSKFCSKVKVVETIFENKENRNTVLLPSSHKGFLIGGQI